MERWYLCDHQAAFQSLPLHLTMATKFLCPLQWNRVSTDSVWIVFHPWKTLPQTPSTYGMERWNFCDNQTVFQSFLLHLIAVTNFLYPLRWHRVFTDSTMENSLPQTSQDRPPGSTTSSCLAITAWAALAARSTQNRIQDRCVDVQEPPQHRRTSAVTSRLASVNGHSAHLLHQYWTPFTRTDFACKNDARRAFRCSAPTIWNSLRQTIISSELSDSLSVFKSRLKTYFFRMAFD